jgi:hypothetical protein
MEGNGRGKMGQVCQMLVSSMQVVDWQIRAIIFATHKAVAFTHTFNSRIRGAVQAVPFCVWADINFDMWKVYILNL